MKEYIFIVYNSSGKREGTISKESFSAPAEDEVKSEIKKSFPRAQSYQLQGDFNLMSIHLVN